MSPSEPIVHVVDDDASFRTAIARLLRASGFCVETFSSASHLLGELPTDAGGCIIADLQMPDMDGIELQEALARSGQTMPLIFLTGHGDIPTTVRAMRQGAEDFLVKQASKQELLSVVRRAMERDVRQRNQRAHLLDLRWQFSQLSPRENQVLDLVVQGKLNKQIAADLDIHERTVKLHRTSITTKLGVHSVAELTRLVQEADTLKAH